MLHEAVRRVGETCLLFALGVEKDQVAGNVLDLLLCLFLHLLPGTGSQLVQLGRFAAVFSFIFG